MELTHRHQAIVQSYNLKSHCKSETLVSYCKTSGADSSTAYNCLVKHVKYSSTLGRLWLVLVLFLLL